MKNRAKCKLCGSIIESCHPMDYVVCKCGEIELNGGDAMLSRANDYTNFVRVDDLGNEIAVKFTEHKADNAQKEVTDQGPIDLIGVIERLLEYDQQFLATGHNDTILRSELVTYIMIIVKILKGLKHD